MRLKWVALNYGFIELSIRNLRAIIYTDLKKQYIPTAALINNDIKAITPKVSGRPVSEPYRESMKIPVLTSTHGSGRSNSIFAVKDRR